MSAFSCRIGRASAALALSLSAGACGSGAQPGTATATAAPAGTAASTAPAAAPATGPCRILTRAEVAAAVGAAVAAGETGGPLDSMCRWELDDSSERSVRLQVVPRDYWEDGARQPGGVALEGIGERAFVGPWLDDERAGALMAGSAVYVMSPRREASVSLLLLAVARSAEARP